MKNLIEKHNCTYKRGFDYDMAICENGQNREENRQSKNSKTKSTEKANTSASETWEHP